MDRELFSRGASPPVAQQLDLGYPSSLPGPQQLSLQQQQQPHRASPTLSLREATQSSSPNQIDALFHNLNPHNTGGSFTTAGQASTANSSNVHNGNNSAPATPMSHMSANSGSGSQNMNDRQSALLSLLGTVGGNGANAPANAPPVPQQIPTPPGSSQSRLPPNTSESQGRALLEQLMSGSAAVPASSSSSEFAHPPVPGGASASGPSVPQQPYFSPPAPQSEGSYYYPEEANYAHHDLVRDLAQQTPGSMQSPQHQQGQQPLPQPPSPQKSIFHFVSPFDALASTSPAKKPQHVPQSGASPASRSEDQSSGWTTNMANDPKRKSVENLLEQLNRGQAPPSQHPPMLSQLPPGASPPYDSYLPDEPTPQASIPPPPLPPKPVQSPRSSPPPPRMAALQQQQRPQPRSAESPSGLAPGVQGPQGGRRDRQSSPVPRAVQKQDGKGKNGKGSKQSSPNAQAETIVFDVAQPLDEVQAPRDAVKSTAIALVRVDQNFLPGTTIGATHWVAYAMTKGRVRVISRSSGDRTLLQLPATFPPTTVVNDMAVYGNRLAGVTSDGGFVVWELPELITDDVPGKVLLCVHPALDSEALHTVKWHPKQMDTVGVASESKIYLLNIEDAAHTFEGQPISQSDLHRVGDVFSLASPLVAFDFDVPNFGIATISEDSTLSYWSARDRVPYWSNKIRGDDLPSSLALHQSGVIIGRKRGTVFQLLPLMDRTILATLKFLNAGKEDPEMYGHANFDARIQTLWVANNRRDSMIACKLGYDVPYLHEEPVRPYFEQIVEFGGPKPTIHFVILTADADPTGEEAAAACVAAKVPSGDLALVAFSVHSSGVDQILIRKEWYDSALASTSAKLPPALPAPTPVSHFREGSAQRNAGPGSSPMHHGPPLAPMQQPAAVAPIQRMKTPPSEDIEVEAVREERQAESKGKNVKGKNVGWKEKESDSGREKGPKSGEQAVLNENQLGNALSKEIRKLEESLHTRLGRLVGKELDKQHQRMEEIRVSDQATDLQRQEKILKLISTELTKNTTRVVEVAVKSEVQNSVLPSLENITRQEVKSAMNGQTTTALANAIKQSLPVEVERLLLRSDVSNQIARNFTSNITPAIERHIKDTVAKTLIPAYSQQFSQLHQDLSRDIHNEMMGLKKDMISWQTDALRSQENLIRELEQNVRTLGDQIKFMSINAAGPSQPIQGGSALFSSPHLRQQGMPPPTNQPMGNYPSPHSQYMSQQQGPQMPPQQQQAPPPPQWFQANIAAPQASHPAVPPPPPVPSLPQGSGSGTSEEWDETYLAVLGTQDASQLRELLARSNPDVILPINGTSPLSQAVVLTLVHRLSITISDIPPNDELFKQSLWWLLRAVQGLNPGNPVILPYIPRVLPTVQQILNTTKQRLSILPGVQGSSSLMEAVRMIGEVQDALGRKPM